jgi:hypothetical protein
MEWLLGQENYHISTEEDGMVRKMSLFILSLLLLASSASAEFRFKTNSAFTFTEDLTTLDRDLSVDGVVKALSLYGDGTQDRKSVV